MRAAVGTSAPIEKSAIVRRSPIIHDLVFSWSSSTGAKRAKFSSPRAMKAGSGGPTALGAPCCEVEQDGVRLPPDEAFVLERRHLSIWIERCVRRCALIAATEIDRRELTLEREVVHERDDTERT